MALRRSSTLVRAVSRCVAHAPSDLLFFCFSLFFSADWSFAIVRAGCSTCKPDPNGVHTVANAWAGGIQHVGQFSNTLERAI